MTELQASQVCPSQHCLEAKPHPLLPLTSFLCFFLHPCRLCWRLGRFGSWWFPLAAWRGLRSGWNRPAAPSVWPWTHRSRSRSVFFNQMTSLELSRLGATEQDQRDVDHKCHQGGRGKIPHPPDRFSVGGWATWKPCLFFLKRGGLLQVYRSFGLGSVYADVMRFDCLLRYSEYEANGRNFPDVPAYLLGDIYQVPGW